VRIILDTNVVLSALLWRGTPHHLLAAIGQRQGVQLCSSTALLEELADVLTRPSASKRLALIGKTAREVLADYVEIIELVENEASCQLYGLLKRPDEKYVTERAYANPKFVEDMVRDVAARLNQEPRIDSYVVESENFESIHNHSAYALIESDQRLRAAS